MTFFKVYKGAATIFWENDTRRAGSIFFTVCSNGLTAKALTVTHSLSHDFTK